MANANPELHNVFGAAPSGDADSNSSLGQALDMPLELHLEQWKLREEVRLSPLDDAPVQSVTTSESSAMKTVGDGDLDAAADSVENTTTGSPSAKSARSSVLSLWFFDSLLSQIWSVLKPKPRHCHESGVNCQNLSPSLTKNPGCCDENVGRWKSCRSCQRRCVSENGHEACGMRRARSQRRLSKPLRQEENCCESEKYKDCVVGTDVHESNLCCDRRLSLLFSTPCNQADIIYESRSPIVSTAKESATSSSDHGTPMCFMQADCSGKDRKNTAFLSTGLNQHCKISSLIPAISMCDVNAIFSGLPGSVLVT